MTKVFYDIMIERFWGTKDISQLACYPLEYYMDGSEKEIDGLCKQLRDRGAKYNKIVRSKAGASQMYIYNGPALSERRSVVRKEGKDQVSNFDPPLIAHADVPSRRMTIPTTTKKSQAQATSAKPSW
jgi:hypothetical protein